MKRTGEIGGRWRKNSPVFTRAASCFHRGYMELKFKGAAGLSGGSEGEQSVCNVGDPGSIPGSGRSSGEANGYPLQCSCLENPMDGGAWQAAAHGVAELDTTERLHFHFSLSCIGEGNGNPLQCSCLENPRDGGAWWATVHRVAESDTTERLTGTQ